MPIDPPTLRRRAPKGLRAPALAMLVLALSASTMAGQGCEDDGLDCALGDLAEQCGFGCPVAGVLDGNANISGQPAVDALFVAVVDLMAAERALTAEVRLELDALAASGGLPEGASGADLGAFARARIIGATTGGVVMRVAPIHCEASLANAVTTAAACDGPASPGEQPLCQGSCVIERGAEGECLTQGTLTCVGRAPDGACAGTCTGDCALAGPAACEGECQGACEGACSALDALGRCRGQCQGACTGTCVLDAGGSCAGRCEGACARVATEVGCLPAEQPRCATEAGPGIACVALCDGRVKLPATELCAGVVEGTTLVESSCGGPAVQLTYQLASGLDAAAQAEFAAWIGVLEVHLGAMAATAAKAERLLAASAVLEETAGVPFDVLVYAIAEDGDLHESIGAACALTEQYNAITALTTATDHLEASVQSITDVTSQVAP